MRLDYGLYFIAIICFVSAAFIFMGYTEYIQATTGSEATDLVTMMFLAILGIVFVGFGYVVRPTKTMLATPKPSAPPKPAQAKPEKKLKKKAVKKRRPKRETGSTSP